MAYGKKKSATEMLPARGDRPCRIKAAANWVIVDAPGRMAIRSVFIVEALCVRSLIFLSP
jgi:hypothetical protein